ncbi:hypothetical protein CBR_g51930 [Chara braunii]|uniref:Clp R domain-containing protein n=1 Tax=Chara braunii TaxID=69332 RepID=A0A388M979_CHABU|nr:hypothetical protein CBR_g51930 [Chara braunii]|eukprot:GBG91128.1 hypothetical protein CBR_g51930 [Chara braunii]
MAVCGAVTAGAAVGHVVVPRDVFNDVRDSPAQRSSTSRNAALPMPMICGSRKGPRSRYVCRSGHYTKHVCIFSGEERSFGGTRAVGWRTSCLRGNVSDLGRWRGVSLLSSSSRTADRRMGAGIRMSLPSATKTVSKDSPVRWSARSIKSFSMAELEARKLKYPTTGTEALLMGLLTEGTSTAARFLRAYGITLFKVRDETVKLLGKADPYYFSPEHPPLTEYSQKALDFAVDEKEKQGEDGEVLTAHMLLGIWEQKGSAGQRILLQLGFSEAKADELRKLVSTSQLHLT